MRERYYLPPCEIISRRKHEGRWVRLIRSLNLITKPSPCWTSIFNSPPFYSSSDSSGIVPSSFRIIRQILDRIEDSKTGLVHKDFHVDIPEERYAQYFNVAQKVGPSKHIFLFCYEFDFMWLLRCARIFRATPGCVLVPSPIN